MADIVLDKVSKQFPDGTVAVQDVDLEIADGEFVILVGPSGCGKSTTLNMIAGLEDITSGELRIGGAAGQRQGAPGPGHRDGVPVVRALPEHDRAGEHGVPAAAGEAGQGDHRPEGRRGGQGAGADRAAGPQAGQPLRRPAAAGGDGPGDRPAAEGVPDGRAAVQPGRQAAGADAHGGVPAAEAARHHHRLRHPRPDRGDDPRRPGGDHARRRGAAGRAAAGAVRPPAQPVRRRLHRLAVDELPARCGRGRAGCAPRWATCRSATGSGGSSEGATPRAS